MSVAETEGSCPSGGLWYTCQDQTPTFLGCCESDPCNGVGCASGDLRAAGLGFGRGPDLPQNDSSYWPNVQCTSGKWYTCALQIPTFQGCCDHDPCGGDGMGCPNGSLFAAAFESTPATLTSWPVTEVQTSKPTSKSSSSSTSLTLTSPPSSTSFKTSASSPASTPSGLPASHSTNHIPAIAGGMAAAIASLVLCVLILLHRRQKAQLTASPNSTDFPPRTGKNILRAAFSPDLYRKSFFSKASPNTSGSSPGVPSPGPPPYPRQQNSLTPTADDRTQVYELYSQNSHGISEVGTGNALGIQQLDGSPVWEADAGSRYHAWDPRLRSHGSSGADGGGLSGQGGSPTSPGSSTSPRSPTSPTSLRSPTSPVVRKAVPGLGLGIGSRPEGGESRGERSVEQPGTRASYTEWQNYN